MAKRAAKRGISVLDPMFALPEGTDEFVYDDRELSDDDFVEDSDSVDDDDSGEKEVPEILRIVEQKLRRKTDGSLVVDVIVEVSDIKGVDKYEIKVAKTK